MGRTKGITVIKTAKKTVQGFEQLYAQLQQKVELGGLSASTLNNYGRCIAKLAVAQSLVQGEHKSLANLAKPLANNGA